MWNDPVAMLMVLFIIIGSGSIAINLRKIHQRNKGEGGHRLNPEPSKK